MNISGVILLIPENVWKAFLTVALIDVVQEKAGGKSHSIHDRFDHEIRFKL